MINDYGVFFLWFSDIFFLSFHLSVRVLVYFNCDFSLNPEKKNFFHSVSFFFCQGNNNGMDRIWKAIQIIHSEIITNFKYIIFPLFSIASCFFFIHIYLWQGLSSHSFHFVLFLYIWFFVLCFPFSANDVMLYECTSEWASERKI